MTSHQIVEEEDSAGDSEFVMMRWAWGR